MRRHRRHEGRVGAKGAVFDGDISDEGFGLTAMLQLPGAGHIILYEPRHPVAYDL